jgi:(1->4)-alpha-D-glucan 1-alpha-D-glucosylmutase
VTRVIPWRATYRLQLHPTFGFHEVERLLPYFRALGISHLYLSPILEARSGSAHGYDGIDPRRVRAEFGGEGAFRALAAAAHAEGLGILLDIVPNHLAVSAEGEPFADVLAHGAASPSGSTSIGTKVVISAE